MHVLGGHIRMMFWYTYLSQERFIVSIVSGKIFCIKLKKKNHTIMGDVTNHEKFLFYTGSEI